MGLMDSPLCGRFGAEEETSAHVLCGCEASAALRQTYLSESRRSPHPFFTLRMLEVLSLGAIWNVIEGTELP
jgi:hypothetical protein